MASEEREKVNALSPLPCPSCQSANQREFPAEMNIHFPGMKGLDIPTVFVFPTVLVCLDCGVSQFAIPEAERKKLAERDYRVPAEQSQRS